MKIVLVKIMILDIIKKNQQYEYRKDQENSADNLQMSWRSPWY